VDYTFVLSARKMAPQRNTNAKALQSRARNAKIGVVMILNTVVFMEGKNEPTT